MRLIDADAHEKEMYKAGFETDNGMQKWDSGLWIRYKLFENAIKNAPTIDAVPVVRPMAVFEGECMCDVFDWKAEPMDYCSFAERKEVQE